MGHSRPKYNSAVSTFCWAVANDESFTVNDPSTELELLYIDDLVEGMFDLLENKEQHCEFDGVETVALIENRWKLSTKEIVIENEYFYIENEENKKLIPLKKAHIRSGASWNKAYQAIKHNRFYNLNKATIKNLLDALGALYILNVYYKDEVKKIGRYVDEIDDHYGSEIFLVHIYQATQLKNHMEYINRNYSSFRTQIHEDKDKAINEEYSGNYLVGPRKTLLVNPQKDIDVKYIAIGGVEREDKSIEESHEIVKCKPADNLEIASWNSFVRKLDEYHEHHPVQ